MMENHDEAARQLHQVLKDIHISSVLDHRRKYKGASSLVSVYSTTPLYAAMDLMAEGGYTSLPVYSVPQDDPWGKEYLGIVSMEDILGYTIFQKMFDKMQFST